MKLGIIGATGWLGGALGVRLIQGGLWQAEDMVLANRSGPRGFDGLAVTWADVAGLCAASDVIVMAARPEDFPMPGFEAGGKLVISFATVWTLAKLRALAPDARLARAMPNGAAPEGKSYTPWVTDGLSPKDAGVVELVLSAMGQVVRLESEAQLDCMAALPGSGLAYPALLAQAMLDHALAFGLPRDVAERAVEAVICDAGPGLRGRMGELGAVIELYRGYRGVTAAGIDAAEAGMSGAMRAALDAAYAKARALGE